MNTNNDFMLFNNEQEFNELLKNVKNYSSKDIDDAHNKMIKQINYHIIHIKALESIRKQLETVVFTE